MKLRFTLAALAVLACTVSQAPAQASASAANHYRKVMLAKNTPIVVQTYNAVNSATFHSGERMAYTVSYDVIVDGAIVAKSGDAASGLIEDARQGRKMHAGTIASVAGPVGIIAGGAANKAASKGANLRVSVTSMRTFCGATIPLSFVRSEYHRPTRFQKMTPVQIAKGQKYIARVAQDTTVCATATTRTPSPIPPDALPPDSVH
ncbi:MAG TPA: hypothetical protein VKT72_10385 [Candidatus Baltobacteraceae bacterium]|nr:hypothetical protein [Candidatus Baltobacteraceae bacterium]